MLPEVCQRCDKKYRCDVKKREKCQRFKVYIMTGHLTGIKTPKK